MYNSSNVTPLLRTMESSDSSSDVGNPAGTPIIMPVRVEHHHINGRDESVPTTFSNFLLFRLFIHTKGGVENLTSMIGNFVGAIIYYALASPI
jgi:hypothetical protein